VKNIFAGNAFRRADREGQKGRKQWGNHSNRHNLNKLLCRNKNWYSGPKASC
jgi:hypothetical protein